MAGEGSILSQQRTLKILKYLMWLYTLIFCATGLAELVTISYILLKRYSIRFFIGTLFLSLKTSYVVPVLIILTTFIGWRGLIIKKHLVIKLFSVLICSSIILHIAYIVLIFIDKEDLGTRTIDILTEKFQETNSSKWWDVLQTNFECCGVHGPADYRNEHIALPFSCCELENGACSQVHTNGCHRPLVDNLSEDSIFICQSLLIILFCQLPGIFLSWIFSNRLQQSQNFVNPKSATWT